MLAYIFDENLHHRLNRQQINYWDIYIEEIATLLGITAEKLPIEKLISPEALSNLSVLIVGRQTSGELDDKMCKLLAEWVRSGGILIGFAPEALHDVFGIEQHDTIKQTPDDYTISAHFDLRPHPLTNEIHPIVFMEQKLLAVSDIACVKPLLTTDSTTAEEVVELAHFYDITGSDLNCPAITWRKFGKGYAGYFAFDAAQTIWVLHQGRPIPDDVQQTRISPRAYDLCILGNNSRKVPYADEIAFVLQNMIAQSGRPFVYQIPPQNGSIAEALLYWGGDEYRGPTELSINASDWMKANGLPYHINLEAENHPMTQAQYQHIIDNGHEISEYYHMLEDENWAAHQQLYIKQSDEFYNRFGVRAITSVNCVLRWNGWADTARWMEKALSQADNSISGHPITLPHPLSNGPFFGFGAATAYPFFFYDNHEHENRKINVIEQPIVCYEIGHRGSLLDAETQAKDEVHLPLEMALKYHMTMNMFYHPIYIARYLQCREAISEILASIKRASANVVHMGNDALNDWWRKREQTTIEGFQYQNNRIEFNCSCDYPAGVVVKVLLTDAAAINLSIDNQPSEKYQLRKEFAGNWLYIIIPQGSHNVIVVLENQTKNKQ